MSVIRAVWVDAGNDPNYTELKAQGITVPFFDAREARLTSAYLDAVLAHPGIEHVGLYVAQDWFPGSSPAQLAEYMDGRLKQIGWLGNALVQFDIEPNPLDALPCLTRWRQLRPKRETYLTIEGHKAGLFNAVQVLQLISFHVWLSPQCYNGAMTQVWDAWAMCKEWILKGYPADGMYPFYDAAHLPSWWLGFAFTQGSLPPA